MNNKLELNWYGKEKVAKVEPRILIENQNKSNDPNGNSENLLIHGDNLLALKALENKYSGKIKCIYIDPPYNTGSAFAHYDDNLEHSTWLSLMKPRLEILKKLLSNDGSIWISIDTDESHYLKVLCDEIFGRKNFIDEIVWQRAFAPVNLKKTLSRNHDTILIYAKNNNENFEFNKLPRKASQLSNYKNPDNDYRGVWTSSDCTVGPVVQEKIYEIKTPSGRSLLPPEGRCWLFTKERFDEMVKENRIWFGAKGNNAPRVKKFLSEVRNGVVATTWWTRDEIGDNQEAKREIKALNLTNNPFDTPKPERLIERILRIGSNSGDLILDSFLGSGTTVAVAHKMGRKWIGIEMGQSAYDCCKKRMDLIIGGKDTGGISKTYNWQGGGDYKFYELAPTLINIDSFGQAVINKEYDSNMLASAIALHEGFKYQPKKDCFWKQSKNDNNTYLYVTTNHVSIELLSKIKSEMKDDEFLVISCKSFDERAKTFSKNITIKKIPLSLLKNCEFDKDNYNLNIVSPPMFEEENEDE